MTATPAELAEAQTLLVASVPGLTPAAAAAWLNAEKGDNHNVLGVTYRDAQNKQHLFSYPTLAAGVQAAANLLRTPAYAPTLQAIAATTDPAAQLAATQASPWNRSYYSSPSSGIPQAIAAGGGSSAPATPSSANPTPVNGTCPPGYELAYQSGGRAGGTYYCRAVGSGSPAYLATAASNAVGSAVAGALSGAEAAAVLLLVNGAILVTILGLAYMGVSRLAPGGSIPLPVPVPE